MTMKICKSILRNTFIKIENNGDSIVFVPAQNHEHLDKSKLGQYSCEVVPVTHITQERTS